MKTDIKYKSCACLGAMYGEPYCPCEMERKGLKEVMENNPVRKAAEYDSAQQWKKFMDDGGWAKLLGTKEDELDE